METPEELFTRNLHEIALEHKLDSCEIRIKSMSSGGANFMSLNYMGTITSSNADTLNLFCKIAVVPEVLRKEVPVELMYAAEVNIYTKLAPACDKLQAKYGVPKEERFRFAKYYSSSLEMNKEILVLDNLVAEGFSMYDRFKSVNWEYASKVVEELAKFHALSLVFKEEYPEEYDIISQKAVYEQMLEMMYEAMKTPFLKMAQCSLAVVPDDMKARLQTFIDQSWTKESFLKYYGPTKWGFLTHSDFRASNIMFKREGGKVKHLIPIDYQGVHIGSPAVDLLYFIYAGTDEHFRRVHLKPLLNHYYKTFSEFLKYFNINAESVFSREEFDEEYKNMLGYALLTAMSILPTVLAEGDGIPNLENDGIAGFAIKPNQRFVERFIPILKEFVNMGVI